MTKYNIYKLTYSLTDNKSVYTLAKEIEINDDLIESQEKVAEDSDLKYYRIFFLFKQIKNQSKC